MTSDALLVIEFTPATALSRERALVSDLPILRNGPAGTFVSFPDGVRLSLPTDQIVFADNSAGRARVGFGGMGFSGMVDGKLMFPRLREIHPEHQLSPDRSHLMVLDPQRVVSVRLGGVRVWPDDEATATAHLG